MNDLEALARKYDTDKATVYSAGKGHGYAQFYDMLLSPLRTLPIKLLEIGVGSGGSIRMWLDYFPNARIFSVDITSETNPWNTVNSNNERYCFTCGDQASTTFWESFLRTHGAEWDVVIDDGGHFANQVITSFTSLWPHVKEGGFYAVEDLYCAYVLMFQSPGFKSHMDWIKDMLDSINRQEQGIEMIHFSRELAIIQKTHV